MTPELGLSRNWKGVHSWFINITMMIRGVNILVYFIKWPLSQLKRTLLVDIFKVEWGKTTNYCMLGNLKKTKDLTKQQKYKTSKADTWLKTNGYLFLIHAHIKVLSICGTLTIWRTTWINSSGCLYSLYLYSVCVQLVHIYFT